ncbi:tryptophan-rich sensory protein [Paracoccus zhejiangensis]|uniref:Tryptophan-rich sensory protein n=1 Tax=Paracoccus zhejiangensis TaxID=1077935 RepID=A0A2H5F5R8_9RHOB|nr:tryptophan-rich sensory protein [Paracoccus zhejiangensis]AUH66890.1 tryptophan-rich sensory protein [Paracoccus zhejiangensis]
MTRYLPHLTLLFAILFALSPLASDSFNGFTPEQFPVVQERWPVQPAGWAFSIWGLIYLWLIAGSAWGLWKASDNPDWQAMRMPLLISLFVGTFWIAAANASPTLATVMIIVMAVAAIISFLHAGHGQPFWQVGPVGLYAGWLTAATGVAIAVLLSGYGIMSAGPAAILLILAVLAVAFWVQSRRPTMFTYSIAVCWALIGIVAVNWCAEYRHVALLAALGIAALAARYLLRGRWSRGG